MPINISNVKGRDAVVALEGLRPEREVRYTDPKHRLVTTRRVLKSDVDHDLTALLEEHTDLDALGDALVKSDPEIDIERFGAFLGQVSRVYVTEDGIIHGVEEFEIITKPDGTVRERRPRKKERQNINSDIPLRWSGKFIKKKDAVKRFVFINKQQLVHVNGLTFDFLYDIAKELDEKDSLMLLRGGEKANEPIILHRGGRPYNAFLEGRVKDDAYCLIVHFSNLELKKPKPLEEDEETGEKGDGEKGRKGDGEKKSGSSAEAGDSVQKPPRREAKKQVRKGQDDEPDEEKVKSAKKKTKK